MRSPHEWYDYVQEVVRLYPYRSERYNSLDDAAQRECDAVAAAYKLLDLERDKEMRQQALKARYWSKTKRSVELIAMDLYASPATIKRWNSKFLHNVAALLGVYEDSESPNGSTHR